MFSFCFKQIIVLMILILSCSRLSLTKPPSTRSLISRHLDKRPSHNAMPSKQKRASTKRIMSQVVGKNTPSVKTMASNQRRASTKRASQEVWTQSAHNRTARDHGSKACFSHIERKFNKCRQKFVSQVQCLNRHIACYHAINTYHYPKCKTVIGYRQIKFMKKVSSITGRLPVCCLKKIK